MEIFPGIHCLRIKMNTVPPHRSTNVYIVGSTDVLLIDGVYSKYEDKDLIGEYLSEMGVKSINLAVITHHHFDHHDGVERILEKFGGKVVAHSQCLPRLKDLSPTESVSIAVNGGEHFHIGDFTVKVVYTSGHCSSHICLYLEREKIFFSGDTILGWGTSIISPPDGNMSHYMDTLYEIQKLDIQTICPGHGPVIQEKVKERIAWYIAHRLERESLVIGALKDGCHTTRDIAKEIYNEEDFKMHGYDLLPRAERSVLAHLEKLERDGVVSSIDEDGFKKYSIIS